MLKIGVVIPVLNNFQGALDLVNSARTYEHELGFYIEAQWKQQKPLAQAWNDGFDRAVNDYCDYILIANDDILLSKDSLDNAVHEFKRLKKDNVIMVTFSNILGNLNDPYDIVEMDEPYKEAEISDHPNYSCFMVDKDFFNKVGRFDQNFWPAWCEDQDSHQRITMLGYRAICTPAASCVHFGGVSTKLVGSNDSSASVNYFIKKWGSHNPNPPQAYATPYNDPNLTAKDWIPNYGK